MWWSIITKAFASERRGDQRPGRSRYNFQRENRQRTVLAHRFSVELVDGPLEIERCVRAQVQGPVCVRVSTSQLVNSTHGENLRYAVANGETFWPFARYSTVKAAPITSGLLRSVRHCDTGATKRGVSHQDQSRRLARDTLARGTVLMSDSTIEKRPRTIVSGRLHVDK